MVNQASEIMTDTTIRRPVEWVSSHVSNVGMVRTVNEDSVLSMPDAGLWAVADGMGGHEAGDVASNMLVTTLSEIATDMQINEMVNALEDRVIDVNNRLLEYAEIMLDGKLVGTTLASLVIKGQAGICMWAGDSRLYRFRNNLLEQLSRDHSHVAELLAQGVISQEEADNHPDSNVITRAVGTGEEIYLDIEIFTVQLGDVYLLCSDGLYNTVTNNTIEEILEQDNIDDAAQKLIEQALDNGAPDNVSVVLVKGVPVKNDE
jgi:serine/threonine protein phosphatase PrpC